MFLRHSVGCRKRSLLITWEGRGGSEYFIGGDNMVFQGNRRRISRHRRSIKERLCYKKLTANEGRSFEYYRASGGPAVDEQ